MSDDRKESSDWVCSRRKGIGGSTRGRPAPPLVEKEPRVVEGAIVQRLYCALVPGKGAARAAVSWGGGKGPAIRDGGRAEDDMTAPAADPGKVKHATLS